MHAVGRGGVLVGDGVVCMCAVLCWVWPALGCRSGKANGVQARGIGVRMMCRGCRQHGGPCIVVVVVKVMVVHPSCGKARLG